MKTETTKDPNSDTDEYTFGSDDNIPVVYANNTNILIGDSDISIVFAYDVGLIPNKRTKPSIRVVLSHDSFIRMMYFWAGRVELLEKIYGERPISLLAVQRETPEAFNKEWGAFFAGQAETTPANDDSTD